MSSWIICKCGNKVHKNLFAGVNVNIVVSDDVLDGIDDDIAAAQAINEIIQKGHVLVKCTLCGRIMIENSDTGMIDSYRVEQ
jgi:hypothetical protein